MPAIPIELIASARFELYLTVHTTEHGGKTIADVATKHTIDSPKGNRLSESRRTEGFSLVVHCPAYAHIHYARGEKNTSLGEGVGLLTCDVECMLKFSFESFRPCCNTISLLKM